MKQLTYDTFRRVFGVFLKNEKLKETLSKLKNMDDVEDFAGLGILGLIELVYDSRADVEIIEILLGVPIEQAGLDQSFEVLGDFFTNIITSWQKFKPLLANFESKLGDPQSTSSNGSK